MECTTIKDDFFSKPLHPIEGVTLMGCRCRNCNEVFFGKYVACQNCGSEDLVDTPLSRQGILYSYTVNRNQPPIGYKGKLPFEPFAVGLLELPEGVRILAPLTDVNFEDIEIGMNMELKITKFYGDDAGKPVLAYAFAPSK